MAVTGRARSRYPNQDALVDKISDYGDDPYAEVSGSDGVAAPTSVAPAGTLPARLGEAVSMPKVDVPYAEVSGAFSPDGRLNESVPVPSVNNTKSYQARVNPDGSVEAPEPGEEGYVPPGSDVPYVPPNGNTGITGGIDPTTRPPGGVQPADGQYPASAYAPIPGFDLGKLNGTIPYDSAAKYSPAVRTFSRMLGAGVTPSRGNLGPSIAWLQANGFPNAKAVGDDKIDFGDGNLPADVIRSDGLVVFQHGTDTPSPAAPSPVAPTTPPTGLVPIDDGGVGTPVGVPTPKPPPGGVPVGTSMPKEPGATGPNNEVGTAFRDALINILNEPEPSLTDPALAARSQANSVAQQRSAERRRAAAAERMAAGGQNGGALDSEVDNILSAQGDAVGAFDSGLLSDAQGERHQRLMGALSPALAAMGIDQQQAQFIQSQLQNNTQFLASLSQQDRQFLQSLGFQIGNANANLNLNALIALLGG
jgi:hypothetical protein